MPSHAFPIGRKEKNIKGGGMTFLKYRLLLKVRKVGDFILQEDFLGIIRKVL